MQNTYVSVNLTQDFNAEQKGTARTNRILAVFEYNQYFVAMMNIVNSARLNPPESGHKHHIIPRCWFKSHNIDIDNSNNNLVLLTYEDHCRVHKLMTLCAKDEDSRKRFIFAYTRVTNGSVLGLKHTAASKAKMSYSASHRKTQHRGWHLSEEQCRHLSESMKGRIPWNKGKTDIYSDETRMKMAEVNKGRHPSDETRMKISEACKGKRRSDDTKAKLSALLRGCHYITVNGKRIRVTEDRLNEIE